MPVILKDIARALDISIITVSKVMRNQPDVAAETRKRVLAKAQELGYRPNLTAMIYPLGPRRHSLPQGRHEVLEDPFTGRSLVRIELLVKEEVAESIMDFVHEPQFGPYPITAFMDMVEVDPRDEDYF